MTAPLLLLMVACGPRAQHLPSLPLQVDGVPVQAEIADSEAEREKGLMFRDALPANQGMLFVYPDERQRAFWMKNTRIPLSIAYIDASGQIVHTADMEAFDESTVPSRLPAMYALEMSRGWFLAHAVGVGDRVTGLPGPAAE